MTDAISLLLMIGVAAILTVAMAILIIVVVQFLGHLTGGPETHSHPLATAVQQVILAISFVVILIFCVSWKYTDYLISSPAILYIAATFAGNWPAPTQPKASAVADHWAIALGILAVLLNLGPISAIVFFLKPLLRWRRQMMRDDLGFAYRDEVLKILFRNLITELFKSSKSSMQDREFHNTVIRRIDDIFDSVGPAVDKDLAVIAEDERGDETGRFINRQREKVRRAYPRNG